MGMIPTVLTIEASDKKNDVKDGIQKKRIEARTISLWQKSGYSQQDERNYYYLAISYKRPQHKGNHFKVLWIGVLYLVNNSFVLYNHIQSIISKCKWIFID